jgi:hypothetical protein
VYQRIRVSQVVEKLVAEPLALMRPGDKTSDIEKLYGDGAPAVDAPAVVRFALVLQLEALASAIYLKIADGPLGVYRGETVWKAGRLAHRV